MSLQQRVKKIEVAAAPMIEEATRERKRRNIGKYGMCKLLCYGFNREEALEVLADSERRMGRIGVERLPHFTDPHIFELFQSFLDDDAEAARLYSEITASRVEGVGFEETLKDEQLHARVSAAAYKLQERMEAYFLERDRANFLEYKALYLEGKRRAEARNEQVTIKSN